RAFHVTGVQTCALPILIARTRAWLERWLERLGAAAAAQDEIEWAGCPAGTCRMGADPRTSVCDSTLRVHATPNLYVCGAEALPRSEERRVGEAWMARGS